MGFIFKKLFLDHKLHVFAVKGYPTVTSLLFYSYSIFIFQPKSLNKNILLCFIIQLRIIDITPAFKSSTNFLGIFYLYTV